MSRREQAVTTRNDGRLYVLDCLRGIASLVVVFWHWQHFTTGKEAAGTLPPNLVLTPAYAFFALFYNYGYLAVSLFFVLSGFIFHRFYASRIALRKISLMRFIGLRISRLYPLHLATLLAIAALQLVFADMYGHRFVSDVDTSGHFLANLFLIHGLGTRPAESYSFNVVTWSISVEMGLYVLFFALFRLLRPGLWPVAAVILIGPLLGVFLPQLGQGVQCFFTGVAISQVNDAGWFQGRARQVGLILAPGLALGGSFAVWAIVHWDLKAALVIDLQPVIRHALQGSHVPDRQIVERTFAWIIAPFLVAAGALLEPVLHRRAARLAALGDISYALYLLHFPLQMLAVIALGEGNPLFASIHFLAGFFLVLVVMSLLTYRYVEMPAQRWLRRHFDG